MVTPSLVLPTPGQAGRLRMHSTTKSPCSTRSTGWSVIPVEPLPGDTPWVVSPLRVSYRTILSVSPVLLHCAESWLEVLVSGTNYSTRHLRSTHCWHRGSCSSSILPTRLQI